MLWPAARLRGAINRGNCRFRYGLARENRRRWTRGAELGASRMKGVGKALLRSLTSQTTAAAEEQQSAAEETVIGDARHDFVGRTSLEDASIHQRSLQLCVPPPRTGLSFPHIILPFHDR